MFTPLASRKRSGHKPQGWPKLQLLLEAHDQQHDDGDIESQERQLQHRDGWSREPEQRGGHPRFDGEVVVLAVGKNGERSSFADVLGHQPLPGLIRVEICLEPDEGRATQQDQRHRHREDHRTFPAQVCSAR